MTRVFAQHVILKEQNQTNWHWTTWNTTTVNERHWLPILFCVQSKTSLTFALLGQMTKKLFSISNFFIFKIKDKHWPILKSQIIFNYCTWILFVKVRSTGNNIPIQSQLWNCSSWHNNTWHKIIIVSLIMIHCFAIVTKQSNFPHLPILERHYHRDRDALAVSNAWLIWEESVIGCREVRGHLNEPIGQRRRGGTRENNRLNITPSILQVVWSLQIT